jgi:thioredoxin 1
MANGTIQTVSDTDFADKTNAALPVLIDFWAPWCGPCKAISPVIEDLAVEYADKITILKMNVDDNPETPGRFGIRAIPTIIVFKDGAAVDQITGAVGKAQLIDLINKVI